jgi:Protein of unknown function (DUF3572)
MKNEAAEEIGIQALQWIAGDPDLCGQFLNYCGASTDDLRVRASEPEFLGFVLDFLLLDDEFVLGFCRQAGLKPEIPMRARAVLPGGDLPNWT